MKIGDQDIDLGQLTRAELANLYEAVYWEYRRRPSPQELALSGADTQGNKPRRH